MKFLAFPLYFDDTLDAVGDSLKIDKPAFDSYFVMRTFSYDGN